MLVISNRQIKRISADADDRLKSDICDAVRACVDGLSEDDNALFEGTLRPLLERAEEIGLNAPCEQAACAVAVLRVGEPALFGHPDFVDEIYTDGADPTTRAGRILDVADLLDRMEEGDGERTR